MGIDPTDAARMATGPNDGADAAVNPSDDPMPASDAADAQRADTAESGPSLIDGLLETQPPGTLAEYRDMPEPAAHALIGAQKFVNGIAGDRDMSGGKPAVVDFIQAAVSFMSGGADVDETTEIEPDTDADPDTPGGTVGGEINE